MKKKTLLMAIAISAALLFTQCKSESTEEKVNTENPETAEITYKVNTGTSHVNWEGVMLGVKAHRGKLKFTTATLTVKGNQLVSGTFTVDMKSLSFDDTNYKANTDYSKEKFQAHLESPDFFDVANYPTASFVIKSVNGNTASGTMTIRDKTNEETLTDIVVNESNGTVTASGKLVFNRKKYGVAFDTGAKDMVISDDVKLELSIEGTK